MTLLRKNQPPNSDAPAAPVEEADSCIQETDNSAELPPGFTSQAAYELHLRVKRHIEADPEGYARMAAAIKRDQEAGLFDIPFNEVLPKLGKGRISLPQE